MKNVFSANSLSSISTAENVWGAPRPPPLAGHHHPHHRRAMLPIRELDFESRIMLNCKLPKKKAFSEQIRKNDFVVDLNEYNNSSHVADGHSEPPLLLRSLKTCFAVDGEESSRLDGAGDEAAVSSFVDEMNYSDNETIKMLPFSVHFSNANTPLSRNYHDNNNRPGCDRMRTFSKLNNNLESDLDSANYDARIFIDQRKSRLGAMSQMANPNNNRADDEESALIANPENGVKWTGQPGGIMKRPPGSSAASQQQQQQAAKKPYLQPINHNRAYKYRIWQCKIYNFLERPRGWKSGIYHILIFATVFLCLILSVLATIHQYETIASNALMHTEIVIVFWLSIELSLRVWSAGCRSRYQTWKGRLRFMKNVFCILVIVASISLTVIASSQNKHKNFAAAAFRGLRFFQILRMLRVDRRAGTWRLLGTVVWAHRQELITTFYIGFLSLIISSFIMYLIEKDDEESNIKTFADSLWWGVITLCTIGYGDVVPKTWGGKLLASSCALIGISFFALPAGILGSGFALKVQAMQRQKHLNRRRAPAATLIQCLWRCYAADPNSMSLATWKSATKAIQAASAAAHSVIPPSLNHPPVIPDYSIANIARPYIGPNSFLNRVTSLKRRGPPQTPQSPTHKIINENKSYIKTNSLIQLPPRDTNSTPEMLATSLHSRRDAVVIPSLFNAQTSVYSYGSTTANNNNLHSNINCPSPDPIDPESPNLNNSYAVALQQVSQIKLQESSKITPVKSSLAHRTLNFLTDFNTSKQGDQGELGEGGENREMSGNIKPQLTNQQKNAIRALRKIKYFVARRKFREALRPYDVTDVIEQYSAGNLDMLARIKTLQFRLDKILGSAKSKECYDSNTVSLASRIVKVERQMEDVSIKLEKFFTSYTLDMKLLMEKTTENCILNENYLKYGDDMFKKEDILPTVITPSMIYHKKSVVSHGTAGFSPAVDQSRHQQGSSFRSQLRRAQKQYLEDESAANDDSFQLKRLKDEKQQIEDRIRKTLDGMNQRKAAVKNRFLFDIMDDDDGDGSYDYDESSTNNNVTKSCVTSLRNEPMGASSAREKSRSDGLIRLVDRRRRKNKFYMRKYLLGSIKYKISLSHLKDFRLKKFKSDNDVCFQNEFVRQLALIGEDAGNDNDDDLYVMRDRRRLKLDKKEDLSVREFVMDRGGGLEFDETSKLLSEEKDEPNVCFTPCSVDPSLTSACMIDLPDETTSKTSSTGRETGEETPSRPPPKLKPMTTGYFSLNLDLNTPTSADDQPASKSETELGKK